MKKLQRVITTLLAAMCLLTACAPTASGQADAAYEKRTMHFFDTFDTIITVIGYTRDQETFDRASGEAQRAFQRYHQLFDQYNVYEGVVNVCTLNREAALAPVKVDDALFDLLSFCKENQPATLGTVNVAMGSVLSLWHDAREAGLDDPTKAAIPDMEKLRDAAQHTSMDDVLLDAENRTVFFADPALKLDVGAVAKGYATERVAEMMLAGEMPHFILSAGGNVRAGLQPLDGRLRWGVSVQDPDAAASFSDANTDILEILFLTDLSAVTSGDYQRYYVVDGIRMHHIISPETLLPADYLRAVTIVTRDSALADLLSTAVFLMPYAEGRAFVDAMDGVEALWVLNDGTVTMTDGMSAMAKSRGASSK